MKLARNIPARIGTGACALALTSSMVIGGVVIAGAPPAGAATLAPPPRCDQKAAHPGQRVEPGLHGRPHPSHLPHPADELP